MKNRIKYIAVAAATGLAASLAALPASAQLRVGVGLPDVDVDVGARTDVRTETYVYDGYQSGHWHTHGRVHRDHYWDARYRGYDCYDAFQYTYEDGRRVRYDSTFCYDDRGRPYEVRDTRVVVRVR
ncbi:MAG: hypothetical protein IPK75_09980 [Acidobacteria bacterium]|nr:hypothetical protein [Acidobacteriota bacterium]